MPITIELRPVNAMPNALMAAINKRFGYQCFMTRDNAILVRSPNLQNTINEMNAFVDGWEACFSAMTNIPPILDSAEQDTEVGGLDENPN